MKLTHVHIDGFGKLSNLDFTPAQGLMVLYGQNEAGKTTFCNFLQALLFDFVRPGAKVRVRKPEKDRYRPLGGGAYGGYADLKTEKGHLRIARDFENNLLQVIDLETGEDVTGSFTAPDDPGRTLFGVDRNVYGQTVELDSLSDKALQNANAVIRDQLLGVLLTGNRQFSIQSLYETLDKRIAEIGSERTPTRPYGLLMKEMEAKDRLLASLEAKRRDQVVELMDQVPLKAELEEIEADRKHQEDLWMVAHRQYLDGLKKDLDHLQRQREDLQSQPASEFSVRRIETLSDRLELVERRMAGLDNLGHLAQVRAQRDELLALSRIDLDDYRPLPLPKRLIALGFSLLLFMFFLALYLFVTQRPLRGILAGLAFLAMLIFFVRIFAGLVQKYQSDQALFEAKSSQIHARWDDYGIRRHSDIIRLLDDKASQVAHLASQEAEANRLRQERSELRDQIEREMGRLEIDSPDQVSQVRARMEEMRKLDLVIRDMEIEIKQAQHLFDLRDRSYANRIQGQALLEDGQDFQVKDRRRAAIRERLSALRVIDSSATRLAQESNQIEEDLRKLSEEKRVFDDEIRALQMIKTALKEAVEEKTGRGWQRLSLAISDILSILTGGKYGTIRINDQFDLLVQDCQGQLYPVNQLSTGTRDQVYFAFGMAVSDLLYSERPFLILDDRFRHYDDQRVLVAMQTLADQAQDRQIFYFTCHKDVCALAENLGLPIQTIG